MKLSFATAATALPALSASVALAVLLLATPPAGAQSATPGCATVEVQNVRPQQGRLMVAAFLTPETFGKKSVSALDMAAGEATMRFEVCNLSGDSVALTLYQDLDGDGKMGRNVLGIPTEPWGASGKPGMMGPTWDTTRMPLSGQVLVVKMSQ